MSEAGLTRQPQKEKDMLLCFLFGHKYHLEEKCGYLFRWCARCGQAHTLDKIVRFGTVQALEWDAVRKKKKKA